MWTLEEGLAYIRAHQEAAFSLDYSLALGGSVLNDGSSNHDLDIFCVPANGKKLVLDGHSFSKFTGYLRGCCARGLGTDFSIGYWNEVTKKVSWRDSGGRKVDWFVVFNPTA